MNVVYIVIKTSILNMCYEIEEFDKVFFRKESAEAYIDSMKKVSDYGYYISEEKVED